MTTRITRNRASLEYLTVLVTADIELNGQPVDIAATDHHDQPGDDDWVEATWIGATGNTRKAQILVDDADLSVGPWSVWVRVTDSPEIPVIRAGTLVID